MADSLSLNDVLNDDTKPLMAIAIEQFLKTCHELTGQELSVDAQQPITPTHFHYREPHEEPQDHILLQTTYGNNAAYLVMSGNTGTLRSGSKYLAHVMNTKNVDFSIVPCTASVDSIIFGCGKTYPENEAKFREDFHNALSKGLRP